MLFGTVLVVVTAAPIVVPLVVDHPWKVRPLQVGLGNVPNCVPGARLHVVGLTLPPLGFHVMVTCCRHLAQYVVLLLGIKLVEVICVPPVAADVLNHPTKV